MTATALVVSSPGTPNYLIQRTIRNLVRHGFSQASIFDAASYKSMQVEAGLFLVQAGCWLRSDQPLRYPPSSATGRPVIALGAVASTEQLDSGDDGQKANRVVALGQAWNDLLQATGSDFQIAEVRHQLASLNRCCWMDGRVAAEFLDLAKSSDFEAAATTVLQNSAYRIIHWQPLDVAYDQRLRVVQVITSIQRGGAERIAIDLHRCWLRHSSLAPLLIAVNPPSRSPFPTPESTIELSHVQPRSERWKRCERIINSFAADVVHTHLLSRSEHQLLRLTKCPTLATIHNARAGWQSGTEQLDRDDLNLIVACSQAVERDLHAANLSIPTRTVWNGINLSEFQADQPYRSVARGRLLKQYDLQNDTILIASLANPRPQKRLERLPAILQNAQQELSLMGNYRPIHLLLAGEPSQGNQLADQSVQLIHEQVAEWSFASRIHWLGCVSDARELLSGIDVLISPSDFEGLSLAHLEALSCGTRVVASDVGGTSEIALRCDGLHLAPAQANDLQFAKTLVDAIENLSQPLESTALALQRDFSLIRMRDGYAQIYVRLANQHPEFDAEARVPSVHDQPVVSARNLADPLVDFKPMPTGVLLITNNFSTGGAQSSARRLLTELKAKGYTVRAAVLQEDLDNPTPGRRQLVQQGIEVQCLPKAGNIDPLTALRPLFESIDKFPPECILMWNVIPEYKMLIADLLWNIRMFDISPGEMNLHSLERYFQNPRPGLPYRNFDDYGRRRLARL
ncbi:MAG: glycosyltransferase [Pirellulales bacterium]